MAIEMIKLPYDKDALEPWMSKETLDFHYDKHHKKYVDTLNTLILGTEYEKMSLEEIVKKSFENPNDKKVFNNAGQAWNHNFFWQCLSPNKKQIQGHTKTLIENSFGSVNDFKTQFVKSATELFGSGWAWLVLENGALKIKQTSNAGTPLASESGIPVLTCDVWEHAYYIDYRNERPKFLEAYWNLVNWDFVGERLAYHTQPGSSVQNSANVNPTLH